MVFQGTHFGPPLWNIFFADVSGPAASSGAKPAKFADDSHTYKFYPADMALEEVFSDLKRGQQAVHQWGAGNRVSFDPGKEVFAVVHPRFAHGPDFELLGAIFDTKLIKHFASRPPCEKSRLRSRHKAILRTPRPTSSGSIQFAFIISNRKTS